MTTYAIGDVQGCFEPLQRLLDTIRFDSSQDVLWFAGDLVNRGPQSLETLRFVKDLGAAAITVLGNHDLHLLALHYGLIKRSNKYQTLFPIIEDPDADKLIDWLRHRPLLHSDPSFETLMVHAGLHRDWSYQQAVTLAGEIEAMLRSTDPIGALTQLYGPLTGLADDNWQAVQQTPHRLRYALNCFTQMRFCTADGTPDFRHSSAPGSQPGELLPWFDVSARCCTEKHIIFGHWAALGLHQQGTIHALDTGCVWGNELTAVRLPDFSVSCVSCSTSPP